MNRRAFLIALSAAVPAALHSDLAEAQDAEFLRALDAAQAGRPSAIPTLARIAPENEPGVPLVIRGRLYATDGRPSRDAIVFAYHTDGDGLYDRRDRPVHSWRLRGWARTDADGRYEFRTIRPAPYPGRQIPAHVHVNVYAPAGRFSVGELRFADDAILADSERQASARLGELGWVRPVTTEKGLQYVEFASRLDPSRRF